MTKTGVLINGRATQSWKNSLMYALQQLGLRLKVIDETQIDSLSGHHFGIIVLDPSVTCELGNAIRQIVTNDPEARVVVFSAAPDWMQARALLRAGAAAYEPKPYSINQLCDTLNDILATDTAM